MLLAGYDARWTPRPPVTRFAVSHDGRLHEPAPSYAPQSKGRPKKVRPEDMDWQPRTPKTT